MPRDFYEVLDVSRDASDAEIKKAYRRLAMEHHPDRNNGDQRAEERFKELTEAYDTLRDPDRRARYDQYGMAGLAGDGFGFHPFDISEALSVFMRDFGGLGGFDSFFGGGARGRRDARRGRDLKIQLRLTIADVSSGTTRKVRLNTLAACEKCGGNGSSGKAPATCRTCGGAGEVRRALQSMLGQMVSVSACPTCGGEGTVVTDPCAKCRGEGRVRADKTLEIEVPPGVSSNNYLTLRGQGAAGPRGGPPGDVIVSLEVEEDERFERHEDDLVYNLPLSFSQAALGGQFSVPHPDGAVAVNVPPGTQPGAVISIRGNGLPSVSHGHRGDLHVRAQVWTPPTLTGEMEEVFRRLAEVEGDPPSADSLGRRIWNRMKESFSP